MKSREKSSNKRVSVGFIQERERMREREIIKWRKEAAKRSPLVEELQRPKYTRLDPERHEQTPEDSDVEVGRSRYIMSIRGPADLGLQGRVELPLHELLVNRGAETLTSMTLILMIIIIISFIHFQTIHPKIISFIHFQTSSLPTHIRKSRIITNNFRVLGSLLILNLIGAFLV
jgi:hypothetical protein